MQLFNAIKIQVAGKLTGAVVCLNFEREEWQEDLGSVVDRDRPVQGLCYQTDIHQTANYRRPWIGDGATVHSALFAQDALLYLH